MLGRIRHYLRRLVARNLKGTVSGQPRLSIGPIKCNWCGADRPRCEKVGAECPFKCDGDALRTALLMDKVGRVESELTKGRS